MLRVGGCTVTSQRAGAWVASYLHDDRGRYGYPSYDRYETNNDPVRLCEGDLLAPVLLNAPVRMTAFADLRECRAELEVGLASLPHGSDLVEVDTDVVAKVGALFAILDSDHRPRGVQCTTLSKILHRKMPGLVPLYDEHVRRVYQDGDNAPVPHAMDRTWEEFMTLVALAMRRDLQAALGAWDDLRGSGPRTEPPISRLRVLDIVAWRLGDRR